MRIRNVALLVAAVVLATSACSKAEPAPQVTPGPSYQAAVDSGEYLMPPLADATALGFVAVNDDKLKPTSALVLLPQPPKGFNSEKYLPDYHHNNELHPYTMQSASPGLPGLILWAHHSSAQGAINRVHLVEFTRGESQAGIKPWKYRCSAPLLKKGAGLADFLKQLPDRFSYLPATVGEYKFVLLTVELDTICVRVE